MWAGEAARQGPQEWGRGWMGGDAGSGQSPSTLTALWEPEW